MSWRNQQTHIAETLALKKALKEANLPFTHIKHGTGTAWGWLDIFTGENPSGLEHRKREDVPWLCAGQCPACEANRAIRNNILKVAWEVTGRHGDYDGNINVLQQ